MGTRQMRTVLRSAPSPESAWWGRVRFMLGMAQMAAAVVAVVLLFGVGVTRVSLTAVLVASSLTSLSVMLFGSRRNRRPRVKRVRVVALCLAVWGCADSVERNARRTYESTLPASSDGSGWSIGRDGNGRVSRWRVRIDGSWDKYAQWVRPRLMKEFKGIASVDTQRLQLAKSLDGDLYTLDLRKRDPPESAYVTATFTARPF